MPETHAGPRKRGRPPKPAAVAPELPKRGRGRPPSETRAEERMHVRATPDQRARWHAMIAAVGEAARAGGQKPPNESEWIRQGLEAWTEVCSRAVDGGEDPSELVAVALEEHARVREVIARLESQQRERPLTPSEDGILRTLAPALWERLGRAGALTLPPKQRRA